jgi:hypothetical protein
MKLLCASAFEDLNFSSAIPGSLEIKSRLAHACSYALVLNYYKKSIAQLRVLGLPRITENKTGNFWESGKMLPRSEAEMNHK